MGTINQEQNLIVFFYLIILSANMVTVKFKALRYPYVQGDNI